MIILLKFKILKNVWFINRSNFSNWKKHDEVGGWIFVMFWMGTACDFEKNDNFLSPNLTVWTQIYFI
jgi:hypothetical protein